jgi:hypothetical protein
MTTSKTAKATTTAKKATGAAKATATKAAGTAAKTAKATAAKAAATAKATAETPQGEQAKSAAYTALGLGLMGAQKLMAQGKAIIDAAPAEFKVEENLAAAKTQLHTIVKASAREAIKIDAAVTKVTETVEHAVAPLEAKLPEEIRSAVTKARTTAKGLRQQFRTEVLEKVANA